MRSRDSHMTVDLEKFRSRKVLAILAREFNRQLIFQ